jgi:hypothetical protein
LADVNDEKTVTATTTASGSGTFASSTTGSGSAASTTASGNVASTGVWRVRDGTIYLVAALTAFLTFAGYIA